MDRQELLEKVINPESFLEFVKALEQDRRNGAVWENETIESFLEAATAWAKDSDFGQTQGLTSRSPWQLFAAFLYAGKAYE
ncbi:MAG: hypothetical protein IPQ13_04315 [Holophagaceae bacterium]|nr:hypothetical protein [Holophagaceae bacterium]